MKYFLHISTSLDDPFISDLVDKFRSDGYLAFFGILEIMSREFDVKAPGFLDVSLKVLRKKLRFSAPKVRKFLNIFQEKQRIFLQKEWVDPVTGYTFFRLYCPKLKDLCDNYTQRMLGKELAQSSHKVRTDNVPLNIDIDVDKDIDNTTSLVTTQNCDDGLVNKKSQKIKKQKTFPEDSQEFRLSKLLFDLIRRNNPKHKKPNLQEWSRHIDLTIRIDNRTPEEIEAVTRWCQQDSFWYRNILSTAKLRDQFDQLTMKMNDGKPKPLPEAPTPTPEFTDLSRFKPGEETEPEEAVYPEMKNLEQFTGGPAIKKKLKFIVDSQSFNTWIETATILQSPEGLIYIEVPSKFHARWIETNYLTKFKKYIDPVALVIPQNGAWGVIKNLSKARKNAGGVR